MTTLEAVAVLFGLASVGLTVRQSIWCWPTGLIQVALFIFIFYQAKLYSAVILHVIYVVLQIYGWHHWLRGGADRGILRVSSISRQTLHIWLAVSLLGTLVWGYLMATFTDASVPYGDAFTAVASLIAQWLMTRKYLESWMFWIAVDVVAIAIYWNSGLAMTSGLYVVFLMLALLGWFTWRRSMIELRAMEA